MKIAVIGAGNGGQAIAGYLALVNHEVSLYDRDCEKVRKLLRDSIEEDVMERKITYFDKV